MYKTVFIAFGTGKAVKFFGLMEGHRKISYQRAEHLQREA
jgi:hypothetical protein